MRKLARLAKRYLTHTVDMLLRSCGAFGKNSYPKATRFVSLADFHVFSGYYDISPFDETGEKLLALCVGGANISPHDSHAPAMIGYIDLSDLTFKQVGTTRTWNWQQGARQQWVPNNPSQFIYNDFQENQYVSIVYDRYKAAIERVYDHPIYSLHPGGMRALSLDFSRLHKYRRGYGYHNLPASSEAAPTNDGIWQMDMATGMRTLMLSLAQLSAFEPLPEMNGAAHYINHLQWAPDGETIVFFHLWHKDGQKKASRLMILRENGELFSLGGQIRPSHSAWSPDNTLLLTGINPQSKALYHVYKDFIWQGDLPIHIDGHPSFLDAESFLSDTYPNKLGNQVLYVSDMVGHQKRLASFYLPSDYHGEMRCDLHPRLSSDRKFCAVDIIRDGRRAVGILPVTS